MESLYIFMIFFKNYDKMIKYKMSADIRKLVEFIYDLRMVCWWYFIIVLNWFLSGVIKSVIVSYWLL